MPLKAQRENFHCEKSVNKLTQTVRHNRGEVYFFAAP